MTLEAYIIKYFVSFLISGATSHKPAVCKQTLNKLLNKPDQDSDRLVQVLAAVVPKPAMTQIPAVVIILILGCFKFQLKCNYPTCRALAETTE